MMWCQQKSEIQRKTIQARRFHLYRQIKIKFFLLCFSKFQENGTVEMAYYCVLLFCFYVRLTLRKIQFLKRNTYHIYFRSYILCFASVKNNLNLQRTFLLFCSKALNVNEWVRVEKKACIIICFVELSCQNTDVSTKVKNGILNFHQLDSHCS